MNGMRGKIGDSLVVRVMRGKTFVSIPARKPDKRKESAAQRNTRVTFREAAGWAQQILLDAAQRAYYQQRAKKLKLPNAYTAAITDYMRKPKVIRTQDRNRLIYTISKPGFTLQKVTVTGSENMEMPADLTVKQRNDRWLIYHTIDTDDVPSLILMITDIGGRLVIS